MPLKLIPAIGLLALLALGGCGLWGGSNPQSIEPAAIEVPPYLKWTVGQFARLDRAWDIQLTGYGVVVGLGVNGSSEVPAHVERYLTEQMLKHKLASPTAGTADVTPAMILRGRDSSVVTLGAAVPIGAPAGTAFDVGVQAAPQTQTRSLDGGHLMPSDLQYALGGVALPGGTSRKFAEACGSVFLNPFIDPTDPAEAAKLRDGRIIGGGKVTETVPIRLVLRQSDHGRASLIARRINERFPVENRYLPVPSERVANAVNSGLVELRVPQQYRQDYVHFVKLVLHLPLRTDAASVEWQGREVAKHMELPGAIHEELALVWEAMGRGVLPIIQQLYGSENSAASFYAARTGLRLGDHSAGAIVTRYAAMPGWPLRLAAIEELGRCKVLSASPMLRNLIDEDNELVRLAAYEALAAMGDRFAIRRVEIVDPETEELLLALDVVNSRRAYTIYATQTIERKIVLFGQNMVVERPVFFSSPDELLTIDAGQADGKLTVYRTIPHTGSPSAAFKIDPSVASLIELLGTRPDPDAAGNVRGLGLSYGQVVSILYQLCKGGSQSRIQAKFVLQQMPETRRIPTGPGQEAARPEASK